MELPSASFEAIDADTGLYYYYDPFGNQIIELTSDNFHYIIRQEITPYLTWMVGYTGIPLETNPIKPAALFMRILNMSDYHRYNDSLRSLGAFQVYLQQWAGPGRRTSIDLSDPDVIACITSAATEYGWSQIDIDTILKAPVQPSEL